jgi:hypothetical protein
MKLLVNLAKANLGRLENEISKGVLDLAAAVPGVDKGRAQRRR